MIGEPLKKSLPPSICEIIEEYIYDPYKNVRNEFRRLLQPQVTHDDFDRAIVRMHFELNRDRSHRRNFLYN
jgi:hypothetical protein